MHSLETAIDEQTNQVPLGADWIGTRSTSSAFGAALTRLVKVSGYRYFMVARFPGTPESDLGSCLVCSNWPDELRAAYETADVFGRCKITQHLRHSVKPLECDASFFFNGEQLETSACRSTATIRSLFGRSFAFTLHSASRQRFIFIFTNNVEDNRVALPQNAIEGAFHLVDMFANGRSDLESERLPALSSRELECLKWSAEGKTTEDIAVILDLSPFTVGGYVKTAMEKLTANSRIQAIARAIRLGLL